MNITSKCLILSTLGLLASASKSSEPEKKEETTTPSWKKPLLQRSSQNKTSPPSSGKEIPYTPERQSFDGGVHGNCYNDCANSCSCCCCTFPVNCCGGCSDNSEVKMPMIPTRGGYWDRQGVEIRRPIRNLRSPGLNPQVQSSPYNFRRSSSSSSHNLRPSPPPSRNFQRPFHNPQPPRLSPQNPSPIVTVDSGPPPFDSEVEVSPYVNLVGSSPSPLVSTPTPKPIIMVDPRQPPLEPILNPKPMVITDPRTPSVESVPLHSSPEIVSTPHVQLKPIPKYSPTINQGRTNGMEVVPEWVGKARNFGSRFREPIINKRMEQVKAPWQVEREQMQHTRRGQQQPVLLQTKFGKTALPSSGRSYAKDSLMNLEDLGLPMEGGDDIWGTGGETLSDEQYDPNTPMKLTPQSPQIMQMNYNPPTN